MAPPGFSRCEPRPARKPGRSARRPWSVCDQSDREVDQDEAAKAQQRSCDEADPDPSGIDTEVAGDAGANAHQLAVAAIEREALGGADGVVVFAAIFDLPIQALALLGAGFVLLTRCLEPEEAWSAIDGNTLVLIFGMLAFGIGLENAGTVQLLVGWREPFFSTATPPPMPVIRTVSPDCSRP